jgi:hypothetical protein
LQPRAAAEARIPTEKLVPYAVSEEHERGQLADKRSDFRNAKATRASCLSGPGRSGLVDLERLAPGRRVGRPRARL